MTKLLILLLVIVVASIVRRYIKERRRKKRVPYSLWTVIVPPEVEDATVQIQAFLDAIHGHILEGRLGAGENLQIEHVRWLPKSAKPGDPEQGLFVVYFPPSLEEQGPRFLRSSCQGAIVKPLQKVDEDHPLFAVITRRQRELDAAEAERQALAAQRRAPEEAAEARRRQEHAAA